MRIIHSNDKTLEKKISVEPWTRSSLSLSFWPMILRWSCREIPEDVRRDLFDLCHQDRSLPKTIERCCTKGSKLKREHETWTVRENERESEVEISYVPMMNDVSHWVEEELVQYPSKKKYGWDMSCRTPSELTSIEHWTATGRRLVTWIGNWTNRSKERRKGSSVFSE